MNKLMPLWLVVLAACALTACAAPDAGPQAGKPINPGDRIGDFLITTGGDEGHLTLSARRIPDVHAWILSQRDAH